MVTFTPSATDNASTPTIVSTPASGSTFARGATTVNVTATDGAGNATGGSFIVTVRDTIPPVLRAPAVGFAPLTIATASNGTAMLPDYSLQAAATDAVGAGTIMQSPAAGTAHAVGSVAVTLTSADAAGNAGTLSFGVAVTDGTAPVLVGPIGGFTPLDVATGSMGMAALPDYTSQASASDNVAIVGGIAQSPAAGSLHPVGPASVTLSAVDAAGNIGAYAIVVNFNDGTLPVIAALPPDRTLAAGADGSAALPDLTGEVSATDNVGVASVTQDPAAGTPLALGVGNVTITVRDAAGNSAGGIVHITVTDQSVPVVTAPAGGFAPARIATGAAGTASLPDYAAQASATDTVGVVGPIAQTPAPGTALAVGTTAVTLRATDAAGNSGTLSFNVIVTDGTAPTIRGTFSPATLTASASGTATLPDYTRQANAADNVAVTRVVQTPTGAVGLGVTHVTLTASDAAGNSASTAFDVTVIAAAVTTGDPGLAGRYVALLGDGTGVSALLDLSLRAGRLSGSLRRGDGRRVRIPSVWIGTGTSATLTLADGSTLSIGFDGFGHVSATLSGAGGTLDGTGDIGFTRPAAGIAGKYTAILSASDGGTGWLSITVSARGSIRFTGRLPDGSKVMAGQGTAFQRDNEADVFAVGTGAVHGRIAGTLRFANLATTDASATFAWTRAGTTQPCEVSAAKYNPATSSLPAGTYPLAISGTGLNLVGSIGFHSAGFILIAPPIVKVTLHGTTGVFFVRLNDLDSAGVARGPVFYGDGVIQQKAGVAGGQFLRAGAAGKIQIGP